MPCSSAERAPRVGRRDEPRALRRQEPRRVLPDRAEALDRDARAVEREAACGAATWAQLESPQPVAPSSSSGMPPSAAGSPIARPISSSTQAMHVSSVPMSGPKM